MVAVSHFPRRQYISRNDLLMLRPTTYVLFSLVGLYLVAGFALYTLQRTLLYFPFFGEKPPAQVGLPEATVFRLKTSDGEQLVSWFVRGKNQHVALYFHGNADSLAGKARRIKQLNELGFSVLAIDYRGFGGSTGKPTEAGLHIDADAAYDFAISLGFAPNRMLLFGESLGSGVSLELASRRQVAGIILDSPYSSIVDVAERRYWMFPVRTLMVDQFLSDSWIGRVHVPILMFNGTKDRTVPLESGRKLRQSGGDNVTAVEVEGAGHVVFDNEQVFSIAREWLKKIGV